MAKFDPATASYKQTVLTGDTIAIDVKKKRSGWAKGTGRLVAYTVGGFGILISCILFVTIIGILPAIGLFFMSLGIIYAAIGKQRVECPHCHKKQPVLQTAENFTCAKCRKLTVLN